MNQRRKARILGWIIIAGVIVLPLAYSLFYLGAFWDPYGRLDQLPVAVVNDDKGAVINGEQRNLGDELVNRLRSDNSLDWSFTDAQEAARGVEGTKYYAVITVPSDFSSCIASAETEKKQAAQITYSANEKRNFLAAQILNRAVLEMEENLRSQISAEVTGELVDRLNDVPAQMQELDGGLGRLSDGAAEVKTGADSLSAGAKQAASGAASLDSGLGSLSGGAQTLSENLCVLRGGIARTKAGVESALPGLSGGTAQGQAAAGGVQKLMDGLTALSGGLKKAASGAAALSAGASSADTGLPALAAGIGRTDTAAQQLSGGVDSYVGGVNTMLSQNEAMTAQLGAIYSDTALTDSQKVAAVGQLLSAASSTDAQAKLQALKSAGAAVKSGAAGLAEGTGQLKSAGAGLTTVQTNLAALSDSLNQLSAGAGQITAGVGTMQQSLSGLSALQTGLQTLDSSLSQLDGGAQRLYDGSRTLAAGLADAKKGSGQLAAGTGKLRLGASRLADGASALADGVDEAKSGVDASIQTANDELKSTGGLEDFVSEPVSIKAEPFISVPNYGTAFAPYFLSLSLYVGALIMFVGIYLDAEEKIPTLSRSSRRRFARVGAFALIGVAQAFVLALLTRYGLGLQVSHPLTFYLACVLTSMVFIAIVEFFMVCLKDAGKFLALLLLILQLTSCGGTFPMELVPKFFNVLYPFMPMTYSVNLFREAISGTRAGEAKAALILAAIGIAFTVLTMLFSIGKKVRANVAEKAIEQESRA